MALFTHDLHVLTGVYALDALDGRELDRYERHLRRCQSCLSEMRGLREVATSLAVAASAEPPAELRERVLLLASQTRQLPPELTRHARRRWSLRGWLSRIPWLIWMPRLATVTAVVAVIAAVVLGITLSDTEQQLNTQRTQSAAIAAVLAAPDARTVTGPVKTGGTTTVVLSAIRHELVVSSSGLAALPADKVYELWLISPAAVAHRAGLLPAAASGRTAPVLASGLVAGDELGMTVEPAGGTSQPTTAVILALKLLWHKRAGTTRQAPSTWRAAPASVPPGSSVGPIFSQASGSW
jgi:anti-sigma-K factor RskA